jgi:hypothetical protein
MITLILLELCERCFTGTALTLGDPVTPGFKGKTECIDHVCARIKLHTRLDIMHTKNSATRIKSYYKP